MNACLLGDFGDIGAIVERLVDRGLSASAAGEKADLLAESAQALLDAGRDEETEVLAFFVPGRIEVIGKHTDYAGGTSLLAAAEKGFCFIAAPRKDASVRMFDAALDEQALFEIGPDLVPTVGPWANYPMTVARRLARNFGPALRGADIAFASDLPSAAGMSSSSVLLTGSYLVLAGVNELESHPAYSANIRSREDLAGYLGAIENGSGFGTLGGDRGVGTFGGSEDHTCMLCSRPGRIVQFAYCPVRLVREIFLPGDLVFAIASSGVAAEKTGPAMELYNRASHLAWAACEAWRQDTGRNDPHLSAALASSPDAADRIRQVLARAKVAGLEPKALLDRFEHFYAEHCQIVPAAIEALNHQDLDAFGRLVDHSQELSRTLLGNQVDETVYLAGKARELGAAAASAFGAGFGGSVWALVDNDCAQDLLEQWADAYLEQFPERQDNARFFLTPPGPAALHLTAD